MSVSPIECLGWVATGIFVASYFFRRPIMLRALQMAGAVLWILYGFLIHAIPVIAANALVFLAAAWTSLGSRTVTAKDDAGTHARELGK